MTEADRREESVDTPGNGMASRYRVIELTDGFRIEGEARTPVEVRLSDARTSLLVSNTTTFREEVGLYAFPYLVRAMVLILLDKWMPTPFPAPWGGVYEWARKRTARAITRRVHTQWLRLLEVAPEQRRLVAKAVFAATHSPHPGVEAWEALFNYPFLVKDIQCYRSAAIACRYAVDLLMTAGSVFPAVSEQDNGFQARFYSLYHETTKFGFGKEGLEIWNSQEQQQELLELLALDWKACFSSGGKAGTSLNRTLMNLPGGVASDLIYFPLVEWAIARPITDRVELLIFLLLARSGELAGHVPEWFIHLVALAKREDILTALRRFSAYMRQPLPATRGNLRMLLGYLRDYLRAGNVAPYRGTIGGLMEEAIGWHRGIAQEEMDRLARQAEQERHVLTAVPPLPMPESPAIRFLSTVEDVLMEGVRMEHCIGSYAEAAVAGRCYLFHVEHQRSSASVMVDSVSGQVLQSFGPCNSRNAAATHGERYLSRWGREVRRLNSQSTPIPLWED